MKKFFTALAVAATAAGSVVALAPTASASGCVSNWIRSEGATTNNITVVTKANSPCHDVNVSWSYNPQGEFSGYTGVYRRPGGSWTPASRGYVQMFNGYHDINDSYFALITDVAPGTQFGILSRNPGDQVTVVH
ncbi:hypothetical protein BX285_4153 [Streptomyces sp. 1114.5]|uniref:hypothetical protein n=1 Tax=unclassified Streptomyces TaxID=2593676 RepID=UPI000BD922E5|nr:MULTISPECIES: hypothetical protein [unclassified Streptomyces]RKT19684.1 hypothetical protein BX285_4153 [Streptomyces sp. 1114.5]SOB85883.1 hypothetical protein SAMN06272789_6184 [Streptomyces sp. 1331.2]